MLQTSESARPTALGVKEVIDIFKELKPMSLERVEIKWTEVDQTMISGHKFTRNSTSLGPDRQDAWNMAPVL